MLIRQITKNTFNEISFGNSNNKVVIATPFSIGCGFSEEYSRVCLRDSLVKSNENPLCSSLIYPMITTDNLGDLANPMSGKYYDSYLKADKIVFYLDRGFTREMSESLRFAIKNGIDFEFRVLAVGDKVQQLIKYANSLSGDESLKFITSNIQSLKELDLHIGDFGDYTRFRLDRFLDIDSVERAGFKDKYFKTEDRVFMSKLLHEKNTIPIMPEMLHHKAFKPDQALKLRVKISSWNSACDGFAVLVDGMSYSDLLTVYYDVKKGSKSIFFHSLDSSLDDKLKSIKDIGLIQDAIRSHGRIYQDTLYSSDLVVNDSKETLEFSK